MKRDIFATMVKKSPRDERRREKENGNVSIGTVGGGVINIIGLNTFPGPEVLVSIGPQRDAVGQSIYVAIYIRTVRYTILYFIHRWTLKIPPHRTELSAGITNSRSCREIPRWRVALMCFIFLRPFFPPLFARWKTLEETPGQKIIAKGRPHDWKKGMKEWEMELQMTVDARA